MLHTSRENRHTLIFLILFMLTALFCLRHIQFGQLSRGLWNRLLCWLSEKNSCHNSLIHPQLGCCFIRKMFLQSSRKVCGCIGCCVRVVRLVNHPPYLQSFATPNLYAGAFFLMNQHPFNQLSRLSLFECFHNYLSKVTSLTLSVSWIAVQCEIICI